MSTPKSGTSVPQPPTPAKRSGGNNPSVLLVCSHCGSDEWDVHHRDCDGNEYYTYCPECDTYDIGVVTADEYRKSTSDEEPQPPTPDPTQTSPAKEHITSIVRDLIEENYNAGQTCGAGAVVSYLRGYLLKGIELNVNIDREYIDNALADALEYTLEAR